jgi:hypothetical protein
MTLAQHIRATLVIGGPLIGGQLAQTLITLTDTVMMGWYGAEELAAVALGASFFHVILIVGMGFALAVMPMVAASSVNGDAASGAAGDADGALARDRLRRAERAGLLVLRPDPAGAGAGAAGRRDGQLYLRDRGVRHPSGGAGASSCARISRRWSARAWCSGPGSGGRRSTRCSTGC